MTRAVDCLEKERALYLFRSQRAPPIKVDDRAYGDTKGKKTERLRGPELQAALIKSVALERAGCKKRRGRRRIMYMRVSWKLVGKEMLVGAGVGVRGCVESLEGLLGEVDVVRSSRDTVAHLASGRRS